MIPHPKTIQHLISELETDKVLETRDKFHEHLDDCAQCRERPFNLCPLGQDLLADLLISAVEEKPTKEEND